MTNYEFLSDDPAIVRLGVARDHMLDQWAYCRTVLGKPAVVVRAMERWQTARRDYLLSLGDMTPDDLPAARDELLGRLERGLTVKRTRTVETHFAALLGRYAAIEDVLAPDAMRARLARIERELAEADVGVLRFERDPDTAPMGMAYQVAS